MSKTIRIIKYCKTVVCPQCGRAFGVEDKGHELEALRAENERLRNALQNLVNDPLCIPFRDDAIKTLKGRTG